MSFPSPYCFQIPLPSGQSLFPQAEFRKHPNVVHTNSFLIAPAKLPLLNTTQQRPKNAAGFAKIDVLKTIGSFQHCTKTFNKSGYKFLLLHIPVLSAYRKSVFRFWSFLILPSLDESSSVLFQERSTSPSYRISVTVAHTKAVFLK